MTGTEDTAVRKKLWRALGAASMAPKGSPPYMDRLMDALAREGLVVKEADRG
jgi:hypothetical protein